MTQNGNTWKQYTLRQGEWTAVQVRFMERL
jgi:hypothetical protein